MFTYYLRFSYQKTMYNTLFTVTVGDDGEEIKQPKYDAIDVIGRIYKSTTTENSETVDAVMQTGFYANVRHSVEVPELEPYMVFPETPERIWA